MTEKILTIHPDGSYTLSELTSPDDPRPLHEAIGGGYLEPIDFDMNGSTLTAWVDEDGLLKKLDPNPPATWLLETLANAQLRNVLVGPVAFTGRKGTETVGVPEQVVTAATNALDKLAAHTAQREQEATS